MIPFTKLTEPKELDFFSVFTDNRGVKMIHINGYCFKSDDHWGNVEFCSILMSVEEFVTSLSENEDYVDELYEAVKQYQNDFTNSQMLDTINRYFNGKPADHYLSLNEITTETPDGNYAC